ICSASIRAMYFSVSSRHLLIARRSVLLKGAFFFFQAEDGIRDGHVTGVQTCALPISVMRPGAGRITVGADKNYDTANWVQQVRACGATPHEAQNNTNRRSAIDERTTRHSGYALSQKKRKRVEEIFGWMKTVALMRQVRHRG